jgi:hypothetical protein
MYSLLFLLLSILIFFNLITDITKKAISITADSTKILRDVVIVMNVMQGIMSNKHMLRAMDGASQATKDAAHAVYESAQHAANKTNHVVLCAVDGATQATKGVAQVAYEAAQLAAKKTNHTTHTVYEHVQFATQYTVGAAQGVVQYTTQIMKGAALSAQHAVFASVNATLGTSCKAIQGVMEKKQENEVLCGNMPVVGA